LINLENRTIAEQEEPNEYSIKWLM